MATQHIGNGSDTEPSCEEMEFEEDLSMSTSSVSDTKFDVTIGHIEDIIMEDEFNALQNEFMEKYYKEFDEEEENKFIYSDIHREYTDLIEKYLELELSKRMPGFLMEEFLKELIDRKEELEGEVFEILLTFSDFLAFKEMFLDYKADKEGDTIDLSEGFTITKLVGSEGCFNKMPGEHSSILEPSLQSVPFQKQ